MKNLLLFLSIILSSTEALKAQSIATSVSRSPKSSGLYLLFLHGKIVEDQGPLGVHPTFGAVAYQATVDTFYKAGFHVISEARPKDTDYEAYAKKVHAQIDSLLTRGVAPERITVLGASKGAAITILASSLQKHPRVNYVVMGICNTEWDYAQKQYQMCGRVLSIYEQSDPLGSSCQGINVASRTCLTEFKEIVLTLGNGHGFLYRPYVEWTRPAIEWARNASSPSTKRK